MTIKDIYNKVALYPITGDVQEIPFEFDYNRLLKEILNFVEHNNYGHFVTSLKSDTESADLSSFNQLSEVLQYNAKATANWFHANNSIIDNRNNSNYIYWHPDLTNSYVKEIAERIEELSGFKIGQIRLAWLLPDSGYSMHCDTEALRFHIPLLTNPWAYFLINDTVYHMDQGKLYHLQTTNNHSAFNLGTIPRLHIVFSTCTWPELDKAVEAEVNTVKVTSDIVNNLTCGVDTLEQVSRIFKNSNTAAGETFGQLFDNLIKQIK